MFSCIVAFVPTPLPPAGSRAMTTPVRSDPHTEPAAPRAATAVRTRPFALPEVRWAAIATGLFVLGLAAQFGGAPTWLWWTLYLGCYVTGGWEPALAGLQALREKTLDVDLLMIVAAIGAAAIGQVLDGGPADRHLRHLRRVGSIPDPAHRRLGAQPARSCSRTCHRHRP